QVKRRLVVEVVPLSTDLLLFPGEDLDRLPATVAALLASGHPALCLLQLAFCSAVVAWGVHHVTVRPDWKDLEAHIHACLRIGDRQGLDQNLDTGERDVPTIRFFRDGDRFDGALDGTRPVHMDAAYLGEDQVPIIEAGTIAILLEREAVPTIAALEPWIPRLFARLEAPEESLVRPVQSGQYVLEHVAVDGGVLGKLHANSRQFCFLIV